MALTVGELNGILSIDDRAVDPALRRAENALRDSGQRMGDDAERAGRQVGEDLGDGIVRGADGRLRNAQGRFVAAGRDAGDAVGEGLTEGVEEGADAAVEASTSRLDKLKTAAAGIGLAASAALMGAFQEAMDQGQITATMGAQLGVAPEQAKRYGAAAGELFKHAIVADFQEGADTIAAVMNAGLLPPEATNAQINSLSTHVADLAKVLGMDVGEAANAAGVMVRNGLAKNGAQAIDMLIQASNAGANRFGDLGDTITQSANNLAHFGLTGSQALGVMVQGIEAGAPSAELLAGALEEMAANAADGAETFDALGLNGKKMAADFAEGGPAAGKALDKLMDRLRGMKDDGARSAAMVALFGEEALTMQDALLKVDPSTATAKLGDFAGAAGKAGDGMRDNAAHKFAEFKNSLQQNVVEFLGNKVIPRLEGFFKFAQNNSGLIIGLSAAVITLGTAFSIAAIGVWAMNSAMLANPIFWIVAGSVAAVAALVVIIVKYWDEIKAATLAVWNWVVGKIGWAVGQITTIVHFLAEIPSAVAAWFTAMKTRAIQIAISWVGWIKTLPGRVFGALGALSGFLISRASAAFTAFRNAAAVKVVAMIAWVRGIPGKISGAIGSVRDLLYSKGQQVVQGLWSGIQSMGSWIYNQLVGWAKSMIPGPIAKALGIASPSKVTRAQGQWIARGLVAGLTGSSKQVRAASTKLADIIRDALAPGRKRGAALGKLSAGTHQLLKLAAQDEKVAARLKASTKKLADLRKARDKLAADVKKGVLEGANITTQEGSEGNSAESILDGLRANRAAAERFAADLAKLRKKGVRSDLIAQIAQAGVEQGSSAAAALASASAVQVKAINREQKALVTAAGSAGDTAGKAMYGAGIHAAAGLVHGLRSQQGKIERQMLQIARGMSKAIRKALGIRSPSRVMAQVGAYTAQGVVEGLEGERAAVNRSMASLVDTPAPGAWNLGARGAGSARRQRPDKIQMVISGTSREDMVLAGMIKRRVRVAGGDVQFVLGK